MANSIELGAFPYSGGVELQDTSIYLGNNRFLRIASQRDNDATIAVMYESSNVLNADATVSVLCEEVLTPGFAYTDFKLAQLGNGKLVIVGKQHGTSSLYMHLFTYDNVNGMFNLENTFNLTGSWDAGSNTSNYIRSYNSDEIVIQPYGNSTLLLLGWYSDDAQFVRLDIAGDIVTSTTLESTISNTDVTNWEISSVSSKIIDDHWFVRTSSSYLRNGHLFDLSDNTTKKLRVSYEMDTEKMADGRYVGLSMDALEQIQYRLTTSVEMAGAYASTSPAVKAATSLHSNTLSNFVHHALDQYYGIIFDSNFQGAADDSNVYARVVHYLDENYAFVSDNSNDLNNGVVVTSNMTSDSNYRNQIANGKFVQKIDAQTYYIQTNRNQFEFFVFAP